MRESPPPKNGVLTQNLYVESADGEDTDCGEEFDDTESLGGNSFVNRESETGSESAKLGEISNIGSMSNPRNTGDSVAVPNVVSQ